MILDVKFNPLSFILLIVSAAIRWRINVSSALELTQLFTSQVQDVGS